jgi:transcriptional regulator with XRE-family HTH domain
MTVDFNPEKLKKLRKNLGLSQSEMADFLDVTKNSVARWERNEVTPSSKYIRKIETLQEVVKKGDNKGYDPSDIGKYILGASMIASTGFFGPIGTLFGGIAGIGLLNKLKQVFEDNEQS